MRKIDAHIHMFPEKVALKTLEHLSEISGFSYHTNGDPRHTKEQLDKWGIDGAVVMHIATKPSQQQKLNDWAASLQEEFPGFFFCCGSVHPKAPDALEEIRRIKALGLRGIKLHPDYQDFMVEDSALFPIYQEAALQGLPVVFHTGWDPLSPDVVHGSSQGLAYVARKFPSLKIVAAHLGGMRKYQDAEETLAGVENVWLDTAMSFQFCSRDQFLRIFEKHGSQRILFGSDCPWSSSQDEAEFLEKAGLTLQEQEAIFHSNAEALFQIPCK